MHPALAFFDTHAGQLDRAFALDVPETKTSFVEFLRSTEDVDRRFAKVFTESDGADAIRSYSEAVDFYKKHCPNCRAMTYEEMMAGTETTLSAWLKFIYFDWELWRPRVSTYQAPKRELCNIDVSRYSPPRPHRRSIWDRPWD